MTNKQAAIQIVETLLENGHQALLAGGCVRDMLLGREAKDYDVATSARPDEIIRLFRRTIKVGAKFGVVMVLLKDQQVEVATFRTESDYADGRHPQHVEFSNPREDAKRRDFTINGMFYDPVEQQVIDYIGGREDLEKQVIRTIGQPQERFAEDYLRMLRAVRFSTQLNFEIASETLEAVCQYAPKIDRISDERISAELEQILVDPNRLKGMQLLIDTELLFHIFPKLSDSTARHGREVLSLMGENISYPLALAALFSDYDTKSAMDTAEVLRLSGRQTRHLRFLLENRNLLNQSLDIAETKLLLSEVYFEDLYKLQQALNRIQNCSMEYLDEIREKQHQLKGQNLRPDPFLTGHDMMELGVESGPEMGHILDQLYRAQLSGDVENSDQARQWVKRYLQDRKNGE